MADGFPDSGVGAKDDLTQLQPEMDLGGVGIPAPTANDDQKDAVTEDDNDEDTTPSGGA